MAKRRDRTGRAPANSAQARRIQIAQNGITDKSGTPPAERRKDVELREILRAFQERGLTYPYLEYLQRRYYPAGTIEQIRDLIITKRMLKELKKCLTAKRKGLDYQFPMVMP